MDGDAFAAYVEQVMVPETVVILDNLAAHKNVAVTKAMRKVGYFSPYSPDLNPIWMAFSKLKVHLHRIDAQNVTDVFHAITEICHLFSPEEYWNYFKAIGYVSS